MIPGFWVHPDFNLEMARYAFNWALHWETPRHDIVLIGHVASVQHTDCRLYAVWWLDLSTWGDAPESVPFAIPGGFTEFNFRSYEPINGEYPVIWVGQAQGHLTHFPVGTVVYVRR